MKIKTKLTLGVGLLFFFILLLAIVGTAYINVLSKDTQNILADNYNTLDYSRSMLIALDDDMTNPVTLGTFLKNLKKQQNNITEIGEKELTAKLSLDFKKLLDNPHDNSLHTIVRQDLTNIMLLNMQAVKRKSDVAQHTADNAIWGIVLIGTFCFVIAFSLLINLPKKIANPIKELTESTKQIASKNYSQRVQFERHDEFGELAKSFNVMAEKLEEYNNSNLAKLMFEKKRIEILINNMHNPIIGIDDQKVILFVNNEALKILGMKEDALIGKQAEAVAAKNEVMKLLLLDQPKKTTEKKSLSPITIKAHNKLVYFEKEIVPISIDQKGQSIDQYIGLFLVLKNVTPFKELDVAKTNFIATISHELKTPISAIKACLQLLENSQTGVLNDDQLQLILSIKDDTNRLLKIIGELLNLSQVETGNIQLNLQPNKPNDILNYALDAVKTHADQKNITLNFTTAKNIPLVKADSEKTAWVLINLLMNAIHYSSNNSKVNIEVKELPDKISFTVHDFGKGIEDKYVDKIFDRYFQIPGSSKAGTGLGLSICKEFIEGQGGEITVKSMVDIGSSFTLTLNKAS